MSQPLIPRGEQSGLLTRIATTESVSLREPESKLAETGRPRSFVPLPLIEWRPNRIVVRFATFQAFFLANVYRINGVGSPSWKPGTAPYKPLSADSRNMAGERHHT
jgi:hypothetical protein